VPNEFTQLHFTLTPNGYQVGDIISQAVKFLRVNLLTESRTQLTPGFNVVFCHNLMIYLDKPTIKSLLQVFDSLMAKEDCLFVDATEAPLISDTFCGVDLADQRVFRRASEQQKTNVAAAPLANSKLPPPLAKTHHLIKETIVQQAQAAYNEKRFDDALDLYDQLVDEHPLWADTARVGKAKIFVDAGEDMAALEAAEDALSSSGSIAGMSLLPEDKAGAHAVVALILSKKICLLLCTII
jgi:hypothetical protein